MGEPTCSGAGVPTGVSIGSSGGQEMGAQMVGVSRQNGTGQKLSKHHVKGTLQTVSTSDGEVTCHTPANTATPESSLHPAAPRLFLEMQILNTWKPLYDTLNLHSTVSL